MENKVLEKLLEELRIMNKLKAMEIADKHQIGDAREAYAEGRTKILDNGANIIIKKIKTGNIF